MTSLNSNDCSVTVYSLPEIFCNYGFEVFRSAIQINRHWHHANNILVVALGIPQCILCNSSIWYLDTYYVPCLWYEEFCYYQANCKAEMISLYSPVIFLILVVQSYKIYAENKILRFNTTASLESNMTNIIEKFKALWPAYEWKQHGYFTDEYISHINIHWLQFGPPEKSNFFTIGVIYFVIMVCGAGGNLLVIFMFIRCKSLRTPANTLIVNLAASDGLITMETPLFIYNCFYRGPALGDIACRIYGFIGGLSGTVSIVTLSAISFDRYFVIKFPLHQTYSSLRLKVCLIVVWIYGVIFSVIPALDIGYGRYTYEGFLTSCSFDYLTEDKRERNFILVFFIAAWVVPLILITFSYANIIQVVVARSDSTKSGGDSFRHVKNKDNKKQEIKLAFLVFCTICLWFLAWTPYSVISLLGIFDQKHLITPLSSMIPAVFCKTASCINPFVYALSHPKFKSELKKICCHPTRVSRENRKIWSTQSSKIQSNHESCKDPSDTEEVVEIDVGSVAKPVQAISSFAGTEELKVAERQLKRQSSSVGMLCLRPTFSNKSSTFRKITRRISAREKRRDLCDED